MPDATTRPTSSTQIYAATPGKRAARVDQLSAAERANASTSSYVGKRTANRPVDAPSGTLTALAGLSPRPIGLLTLDRPPVDFSAIPTTARTGAVAAPVTGRPTAPIVLPEPRRSTDLLDTGTIDQILAGLEPVDHTTTFTDDVTEQMALLPASPGKRRATRHTGRRGPLFRVLPSAPMLLGVAALAISAGGAITAGHTDLVGASHPINPPASALNGVSGSGTVGGARGESVSRDTDRAAAAPVEAKAEARSAALGNVNTEADQRAVVIAKNLWQTPLDSYRLTARFGQYGLWASYHTGLDFAAPSGTPIHAIANGVVSSAGYDGSYGNKTVVTLDDGTELWYCHQTSFAVSVGDTVRGGETIGYVGSTGNVTGPHVHIEVRPGGGDPVDPYPAFVEHGVTP